MICPECGYLMDAFDKECVRCHGKGLKKTTPSIAPVPAPVVAVSPSKTPDPVTTNAQNQPTKKQAFVCAFCGSENVQTAPAVSQAGKWTSKSAGLTAGIGGVIGRETGVGIAPTIVSTGGSSQLAELLSPPPTPSMGSASVLLCVVFALSTCIAFVPLMSILKGNTSWTSSSFWAPAFFAGLMLFLIRKQQAESARQYQNDHANWERKYTKWEHIIYCSRCNQITDLQTGETAQASQIQSFISR